jgi:uncharacterized small protein (DUF1192 family)
MIDTIDTADALQSLKPNAEWVLRDDVLEWLDSEQTEPTALELSNEVTRLQAEYASKQYQRDRAKAYPSLTEQADMAYWDRKNGTTTLDDALDAIKAEFPKPE